MANGNDWLATVRHVERPHLGARRGQVVVPSSRKAMLQSTYALRAKPK